VLDVQVSPSCLVLAGALAFSQSDFSLLPHDSDSRALSMTDDPTITSVFMDPSLARRG
jgi:hypothetical protein